MADLKMNQSTFERFARIVVGGILLILATYVPMGGILVWVLVIVGLILMLTGLAGWCPIYSLFKISTK